jgi:formiminoglutamase
MLENWLKPSSAEKYAFSKESFGEKVHFFHQNSIENSKIALIGIEQKESDAIKEELYNFSICFSKNYVTDLGVFRKKDPNFIIGAMQELINSGIIPIIFGADEKFIQSQFKSYHQRGKLPTALVIDSELRFSVEKNLGGYINDILETETKQQGLAHLSILGTQAHLTDTNAWNSLEFQDFDLIRLGVLRQNLEETEPLIREADGLAFHINALRYSETNYGKGTQSSGLFLEDACQMMKYAGMSDKLSSIGFYGYEKKYDKNNQAAKCIAEMIWYFVEGVTSRKGDYPVSLEGMTEYLVEIKGFNDPFTFWKSNKSQRWWIQIPNTKNQNHLLSCSYKDYQEAINGELPERIWNGFKRFS